MTIQLEHGRRYRTRDGLREFTVIRIDEEGRKSLREGSPYQFRDANDPNWRKGDQWFWLPDGRYLHESPQSPRDLVELVGSPPAPGPSVLAQIAELCDADLPPHDRLDRIFRLATGALEPAGVVVHEPVVERPRPRGSRCDGSKSLLDHRYEYEVARRGYRCIDCGIRVTAQFADTVPGFKGCIAVFTPDLPVTPLPF